MAKKSKKKSDKKAKAEEAKRLKALKKAKKAAKADAKKAKADSKPSKDAKSEKSAKAGKGEKSGKGGKAEKAVEVGTSETPAESPADDAAEKPDQVELLKLALRSTEAKLVDAEHRLRQVQQQLDGERRQLADASSDELLEDALVDAAVEATVAEVLIEAEAEAEVLGSGLVVSDAELVEVLAEQIDVIAVEVEPLPVVTEPEPSTGEAEAAAEVFEDAGLAVVPPVSDSELTPPIPAAPEPGEPNASWTLLKLREEAKRRGLQSTSSLPKAALLARLQQA